MNDNFSSSQQQLEVQEGLNAYISKVFGKMFLGLLVTAIAAVFTVSSETMLRLVLASPLMIILIIAEFVIVFALSARIAKISYASAQIMFYVYAVVNGLTLASIFLVYNIGTIYTAFISTAVSFGVMAIYGMVTKNDLTKIGSIFIMALIGVIIASVINMFLKSSQFDLIISFVAVVLFAGLVAFDTQKLKSYYYSSEGDPLMRRKIGILGALSLYLDFINIFLYLLRIFGNNRRD